MTSRERTLLAVVLGLIALLGAGILANNVIVQPLQSVKQQIAGAEAENLKLAGEIATQKKYSKRVQELSPRLAQWRKLSLPEGSRKPEAFKTHLSTLSIQYQRYLSSLLSKNKFQRLNSKPPEFDFRNVPHFDTRNQKPIYAVLKFALQGETELANVAQFFEDLSRTPLLHQIKSFSIASQRTSRNLTVKMSIEVLLVTGAQPLEQRKKENAENRKKGQLPAQGGGDIVPTFSGKGKDRPPVILAAPHRRNYGDIARKSIFTPTRDTGPSTGTTGGEVEPLSIVLPYVKLTLISDSDYYGCWVARMHNLGNKEDNALLIAGPLPTQSRYQEEKKELERRKKRAASPDEEPRERLIEPVRSWIIKDKSKTALLEVSLVRIDPLRVILQVEDLVDKATPKRLYSLSIGGDLKDVMDKPPLDKEAIRKLGLASDPVEVFKKVKLVELRFRQDRRDRKGAFEGTFTNPEKGDKPTLSTETLPEELDIPDEWGVHDRFDSELLRLKVVRVESGRLIFVANNKHYAIKPGESLHAALARPLSDAEVKAITSKAP